MKGISAVKLSFSHSRTIGILIRMLRSILLPKTTCKCGTALSGKMWTHSGPVFVGA